jgi:hypothetical protein
MTHAIADALLETLASVELHAGEAFDLDTSVSVLEAASALLRDASSDERELLVARGAALAARTPHPDKQEFLANVGESLGIGA